jgi:glycosyltransferase involved in cell wall biosynthesis
VNVLLLSTHLNTGGITSYLFTLAKGLVQRGHSVHVITSGGNKEEAFLSAGAKIKVLNIRTKSELDPKIYMALNPLSRYMRDHKIDIIHAHTRITQVMGAWLKRRMGCPYLSTCHGFFRVRLSRKLFPCWGDAVIAISGAVEDHLINDFGVSKSKVYRVENGVDLDEFTAPDSDKKIKLRKQFDLGAEPIIGMIARLSDVKGPDVLVEAFKRVLENIPDAKLLLVGEGKMECVLRGMVERLQLQEHVRFFPVVNRTSEMLSLFDIFAMPSRQEGLGLSIMEAQAAGLPVVATRVGGIPSLIENGKTGVLVEPGNSDALAKAIVKLWGDQNQLREIGTAARESIRKNHSAYKMLDKTIDLYQQLITH